MIDILSDLAVTFAFVLVVVTLGLKQKYQVKYLKDIALSAYLAVNTEAVLLLTLLHTSTLKLGSMWNTAEKFGSMILLCCMTSGYFLDLVTRRSWKM
jgi:hypothetical protein